MKPKQIIYFDAPIKALVWIGKTRKIVECTGATKDKRFFCICIGLHVEQISKEDFIKFLPTQISLF
jgi:hypothetical protein